MFLVLREGRLFEGIEGVWVDEGEGLVDVIEEWVCFGGKWEVEG